MKMRTGLSRSLRTVPGKNKRHKKEVGGLVSGVESGVSKERLRQAYNSGEWRSVRQHTEPQTILMSHMCVDAQTEAAA